VAAKALDRTSKKERLLELKLACSQTIHNAAVKVLGAGGASVDA
jgi:hypothetical protein